MFDVLDNDQKVNWTKTYKKQYLHPLSIFRDFFFMKSIAIRLEIDKTKVNVIQWKSLFAFELTSLLN